MTSEPAVTIAVVGVLATCVGGLIWVIKTMFGQIIPLIENGNKVISKLVTVTSANTKATIDADAYLKKRNGRDAELAEQLIATTAKSHKEIIKAIAAIPDQIVAINTVIAKSSKGILGQLEDTAAIAAEDRDVLTNQNLHIKTEVNKIVKGKEKK